MSPAERIAARRLARRRRVRRRRMLAFGALLAVAALIVAALVAAGEARTHAAPWARAARGVMRVMARLSPGPRPCPWDSWRTGSRRGCPRHCRTPPRWRSRMGRSRCSGGSTGTTPRPPGCSSSTGNTCPSAPSCRCPSTTLRARCSAAMRTCSGAVRSARMTTCCGSIPRPAPSRRPEPCRERPPTRQSRASALPRMWSAATTALKRSTRSWHGVPGPRRGRSHACRCRCATPPSRRARKDS